MSASPAITAGRCCNVGLIHLEKWEDEASLQAHLEIPDEEFSEVMTNTSIVSARVTSYEAADERVLMSR